MRWGLVGPRGTPQSHGELAGWGGCVPRGMSRDRGLLPNSSLALVCGHSSLHTPCPSALLGAARPQCSTGTPSVGVLSLRQWGHAAFGAVGRGCV